jgi:hypothetical protein
MAGVMKVRKKKRNQSSFTTLQGIVLSLSIGTFVALVLLVALYWHPPE